MPLIIPENSVKWAETEDKLNISVPLPNTSHNDVTILSTNSYVKVSQPPHFWECFLLSSIDSDRSIARIGNNLVTFELFKSEKRLWGSLKHSESGNGEFCRQQRENAVKETHEKAATSQKNKCTERYENQQASVRKQIELDEMERKRINDLKETERKLVTEEVEKLKNTMPVKSDQTLKNAIVLCPSSESSKAVITGDQAQPLRKFGNIAVSFTPRVFRTAARESQAFDEIKWLEKQAAARKSTELDMIEFNQKEKNPIWLKEKGEVKRNYDVFSFYIESNHVCSGNCTYSELEKDTYGHNFSSCYACGDLHSAVNAYNLAICICPTMYSLYSNRAACHLQLQNLHKAIEDASKALELMGPLTNSNSASCCKCHVRRAVAFCQLELYVEGYMDFEAALKIEPHNEALKDDAEKIRTLIQ